MNGIRLPLRVKTRTVAQVSVEYLVDDGGDEVSLREVVALLKIALYLENEVRRVTRAGADGQSALNSLYQYADSHNRLLDEVERLRADVEALKAVVAPTHLAVIDHPAELTSWVVDTEQGRRIAVCDTGTYEQNMVDARRIAAALTAANAPSPSVDEAANILLDALENTGDVLWVVYPDDDDVAAGRAGAFALIRPILERVMLQYPLPLPLPEEGKHD